MTQDELKPILEAHVKWLRDESGGSRADLSRADLSRANMSCADLSRANMSRANMSGADLSGADLSGADLSGAYLSGADLSGACLSRANLWGANLWGAYLFCANMSGANMSGANMSGAYLSRANLGGANLSNIKDLAFQIPQEGELIVYKKLSTGIAQLRVPPEARRTATPIGRKCRAEFVEVLSITKNGRKAKKGKSRFDGSAYVVGEIIRPDSYNDDIRLECANGIHFFLTKEEAEAY
jgi:uncharacterized protein DUF5758/pentapeptide repeat protein